MSAAKAAMFSLAFTFYISMKLILTKQKSSLMLIIHVSL